MLRPIETGNGSKASIESRLGTGNSAVANFSDLEQQNVANREVKGNEDDADDFDLGKCIRSRTMIAESEGVHTEKAIAILWRSLLITAPDADQGSVRVKTLFQSIINTFTIDPMQVLFILFPSVGNFFGKNTNSSSITLIHRQDGIVKAGEMLLVLGRPGSGCSTLLRALTASLDSNVIQSGEVEFGGLSIKDIKRYYRGEVIFSDEDDIHYPTLTVAQTLQFALKNKVPTRTRRLQQETRNDFIDKYKDAILRMFAMSHVQDTIVGDASIRGVSGGEKKRVTIGEALIGRSSVMAWDNSTRGLDASTALDYAKSLRIMTDLSRRTTIATLYQVSESIYEHFDRIIVIDEGRCIYYGPRHLARQYFHGLGYYSPPRQTTADFLTAVTDPDQVQFREGYEERAPKTAAEREQSWQESKLYANLIEEMDKHKSQIQLEGRHLQQVAAMEKNKGVKSTSPYTVSFREQIKACIGRQLLIRWGSKIDMQIKLFTIISISLVIGALFFGQAYDSAGIFTRGGVLLFLCLLNGWLQFSEAFEAVAGRPILARHRQFAFHRPSAVVVARAIVDIPLLLVQCFLTCIIVWGLAGLRRTAGAFFITFAYVFLSAYNLTALYRAIAALSSGFNEAIRFSVLAFNVIILFVGYVIRRPQMNWMIWLNYVNGISYAFEALLVNEIDKDIPCNPAQIIPFYEEREVAFQTCALAGAKLGILKVSAADYLSAAFRYKHHTVSYNWAVLISFTVIYIIITVIATELINWSGGGRGTTVFASNIRAKARIDANFNASQVKQETLTNEQKDAAIKPNAGKLETTGEKLNEIASQQELNEKAIFTWKDLNLTLPNGRKLLQHIDGWVKPGEMTALMGASGAGKTTLMSCLSQRGVAAVIRGEIFVDGRPLERDFQKGTGLVLQGDVHMATQTVQEAITFSAVLRQPAEVPHVEKMRTVEHVLDSLELRSLQDAIIGEPGAGLSLEKRKRVTIGVELAAKPDLLLFLDEPTSGLDSAGAASIVRLLRKLAREGQAILCTIHQPSALLFEHFDNVLLLRPGGQTAYFGRIGTNHGQGSEIIRRYFEDNGASPCPPDGNAAEYILEIVSSVNAKKVDWARVWRSSSECKSVRSEVDRIVESRRIRPYKQQSKSQAEYSATAMTQLREVTKRQMVDIWRDSSFSYGILFSNLIIGLVAGGAFANLSTTPTSLQDRVFIVFLILLNVPSTANSVMGKFFSLRILYEARERESKIYSWWVLVTSFILTALPLAIVCSVVYFLPSFFIPFNTFSSSGAGFFYLSILTMQIWMFLFAFLVSIARQLGLYNLHY